MHLSKDDNINLLNIALMLLSCVAAFAMPFEVFLFAYAVMGPLHYLTEISWLHDRKYFTKGKYDHLVLWLIGIIILLQTIAYHQHWNWPFSSSFRNKIVFVALSGSLLMVFVSNAILKVGGLLLLLVLSNVLFAPDKKDGLAFFIGALLPTLVHVYLFTGFFMLYGALKARSKSGLWSVVIFVACPFLLYFLFRDKNFMPVTNYGASSYFANGEGFFRMNVSVLQEMFAVHFPQQRDAAGQLVFSRAGAPVIDYTLSANIIFHSQAGILLMRFIAFAYTYHYLNWFSKTGIIRWHKVPKSRYMPVLGLWLVSLVVYGISYTTGLRWLFFLSLTHVLLEFPLNVVSVTGIGKEIGSIARYGFKPAMTPSGYGIRRKTYPQLRKAGK